MEKKITSLLSAHLSHKRTKISTCKIQVGLGFQLGLPTKDQHLKLSQVQIRITHQTFTLRTQVGVELWIRSLK